MNAYVSEFADSNKIFETKELTGKFSLDGLASCAFGVETGSFKGKESEFLRHCKGIFSFENILPKMLVTIFTPNIIKKVAA